MGAGSRLIAALLPVVILVVLASEQRPGRAARFNAVVPGRIIVKSLPSTSTASAQSRVKLSGVVAVPRLGVEMWSVPPGTEDESAAALAGAPGVEYAEPDLVVYAAGPPRVPPAQWPLEMLRVGRAWDFTTGTGAVVAVIDSGFELGHPDGPETVFAGCDFVTWDRRRRAGDCPSVADDANGHGTAMAGIVAGRVNPENGAAGVAPGAAVFAVRVLDEHGVGAVSNVAEAIKHAADAGARVLNLSLGTGPSRVLADAVRDANARGAVIVAPTGNSYDDGNPLAYPAALPDVVGVGGVTASRERSPFSGTGPHVRVVAPAGGDTADGVNTWLPFLARLPDRQALGRGTSAAAAYVSGVVALALSTRPELDRRTIVDILTWTAQPIGERVPNDQYGYGVPDAAASAIFASLSEPTATAIPATATSVPTATPIAATATSVPTIVVPAQRRAYYVPAIAR